MKILHIIPTLSKGGAERLVIDIIKQLNKQENTQAHLVIFRDEIKYDISEICKFISIVPSSVNLSLTKKWCINIDNLQKYIEEFKPDIIHTHLFEAELTSRFCNYSHAKWFSHFHDNMVQFENLNWSTFLSKTKITNLYEKIILFKDYKKNGGTNFIAISKHTEDYIKSIQSKYPVTLLHNAINVNKFQKRASIQPSKPNPQPHHSTSSLNLINIGSFVPKKNQTFILDIIIKLNKNGFQVNCIFLGDGPLKIEVEIRAKELGISNQCQFLGNVENVEKYLWQSDIYLHTATYEPLGLVILEAMASGLPVVTLDGGGNRDLMINGINGYLLEKQDIRLFAEKIIKVYQNKEIRNYNINYAQNFDIKFYCSKLLELYNNKITL